MEILLIGEINFENTELFFDKLASMKGDKIDTVVFTKGFFKTHKLIEEIYKLFKRVFIVKYDEPLFYTMNKYGWLRIIDKPRRFIIEDKKVGFCPVGEKPIFKDQDADCDILIGGIDGIKIDKGIAVFDINTERINRMKKVTSFNTKYKDIPWDNNKEYNYYHLNKEIGPNGEKEVNPGKNTITFYTPVIHV